MPSAITFGKAMPTDTLPDWEEVLSAAARLQRILPEAVLVGGSASAVYAGHRMSVDADHVLTDLRQRFDEVLAELESVAGWKTARVQRPVQILGSLDGIDTGVRQLIRDEPLETTQVEVRGQKLTVPSQAEIPHQGRTDPEAQCHARLSRFRRPGRLHRRGQGCRRAPAFRPPLSAAKRRIGGAAASDSASHSAALRS